MLSLNQIESFDLAFVLMLVSLDTTLETAICMLTINL